MPAANGDERAFSIFHTRKNKDSCYVTATKDGLFRCFSPSQKEYRSDLASFWASLPFDNSE